MTIQEDYEHYFFHREEFEHSEETLWNYRLSIKDKNVASSSPTLPSGSLVGEIMLLLFELIFSGGMYSGLQLIIRKHTKIKYIVFTSIN